MRRLLADKSKVAKAAREAEDSRFIHHTLSEVAFQRIYTRYESQLNDFDIEIGKLGKDYSKAVQVLERILRLAEDICEAYEEANDLGKRSYLGLFFKSFKIKKGKVVSFALADNLKPLIKNGSVHVRHNGLPAPYASIQQSFEAIIQVFENVSYTGELKQRWIEIKRLENGAIQNTTVPC